MAIVELYDVTMEFGGLTAVDRVSLAVNEREILGLIGPNGAGKTTIFNMISGIYQPTAGEILFNGKSISSLKPSQVAYRGIARTFQNIRLFSDLTVLDNVRIGCHTKSEAGLLGALFRWPGVKAEEKRVIAKAEEYLELVGLTDKADELARNLAYGEQRRLEIARALAMEPTLLLLDEPAAGMNSQEKQTLMDFVRQIRERGITVLLVEHDMNLVMGICERIVVLDYGKKLAEGTPQEIQRNNQVIASYLGVSRETDDEEQSWI